MQLLANRSVRLSFIDPRACRISATNEESCQPASGIASEVIEQIQSWKRSSC